MKNHKRLIQSLSDIAAGPVLVAPSPSRIPVSGPSGMVAVGPEVQYFRLPELIRPIVFLKRNPQLLGVTRERVDGRFGCTITEIFTEDGWKHHRPAGMHRRGGRWVKR